MLLFLVNQILDLLKEDTDMGLLDLGANIGMYTLPAARMGKKV